MTTKTFEELFPKIADWSPVETVMISKIAIKEHCISKQRVREALEKAWAVSSSSYAEDAGCSNKEFSSFQHLMLGIIEGYLNLK